MGTKDSSHVNNNSGNDDGSTYSSIHLLTVPCTALSALRILILLILRRKFLSRCHSSNLKAIRLENRKSQCSSSNLKAICLRIPSCSVQAIN